MGSERRELFLVIRHNIPVGGAGVGVSASDVASVGPKNTCEKTSDKHGLIFSFLLICTGDKYLIVWADLKELNVVIKQGKPNWK